MEYIILCLYRFVANLTATMPTVISVINTTVSMACELSGYLMSSTIQWIRNDINITSNGKYVISESIGTKSSVNASGVISQSIISNLTIVSITEQDSGVYTCTVPNTELMENITVSIGILLIICNVLFMKLSSLVRIISAQSMYSFGSNPNSILSIASMVCIIEAGLSGSEVDVQWRHDNEVYTTVSNGRHVVIGTDVQGINYTTLYINPVSYQDNGIYYCDARPSGSINWTFDKIDLVLHGKKLLFSLQLFI